MGIYSQLLRPVWIQRLLSNSKIKTTFFKNIGQIRTNVTGDVEGHHQSQHHQINMTKSSSYQFKIFKNLPQFCIMLGGILPIFGIMTYSNILIGSAKLTELSKDGEDVIGEEDVNEEQSSYIISKYWEYYRHPVSRFLLKYLYLNLQKDYEKMCQLLSEENEKRKIRKLETKEVKNFLKNHNDYQTYYYRSVIPNYHRISKAASEYLESIKDDNF